MMAPSAFFFRQQVGHGIAAMGKKPTKNTSAGPKRVADVPFIVEAQFCPSLSSRAVGEASPMGCPAMQLAN